MKRLVIVLILFAKIGISQDTLAFELLNKYRTYHNKSALVMNISFSEYAIDHCEDMASKNKVWHTNNFPSHRECVSQHNGEFYLFGQMLKELKFMEEVLGLDIVDMSYEEFAIGKHLYGYDHSPSHKKILLADDNVNGYFHINIDKIEKKYDPFAKLTYYDMVVNSCVNINR
jgi:hypothetical protein